MSGRKYVYPQVKCGCCGGSHELTYWQVRCDCCGDVCGESDGAVEIWGSYGEARVEAGAVGWTSIGGDDLCPECWVWSAPIRKHATHPKESD